MWKNETVDFARNGDGSGLPGGSGSALLASGAGAPLAHLPPIPDFRYVGLRPGPRIAWASLIGAGATIGAGVLHGANMHTALFTAVTAVTAAGAAIALRGIGGARVGFRTRTLPMAIVPWGILIGPDATPRVLRWAAVKNVKVEMIHGRDQATPTTLWSVVTIETDREKLAARAPGAVSLDRLVAHLEGYREEQSHAIALDLDGERAADGPGEPDCEPLLNEARAYVESAPASSRLGLPGGGYRRSAMRAASDQTIATLHAILRDKTPRPIDPRAFAAVVAAELNAVPLADDLVALAQSPHPVVAAVAKIAARRLGVSSARVGALDEIVPFLTDRDVETLEAWAPPQTPSPPAVADA